VQVWIGSPDSTHETARYLPPPPQDVPKLVDQWLLWWQQRHGELRGNEKGKIITGLAELHHCFLSIHPFMDANGTIARTITDQAARELLNQSIGPEFVDDSGAYYLAVSEADKGHSLGKSDRGGMEIKNGSLAPRSIRNHLSRTCGFFGVFVGRPCSVSCSRYVPRWIRFLRCSPCFQSVSGRRNQRSG
jgi:hypothetical protein